MRSGVTLILYVEAFFLMNPVRNQLWIVNRFFMYWKLCRKGHFDLFQYGKNWWFLTQRCHGPIIMRMNGVHIP